MPKQTGADTVADRIHRRRLELGLSQRELAVVGVSYAYISRIEAGARTPSVKALPKLAPKLGVSVAWLETGEEDAAEALAELVLEHEGRSLPPLASMLAIARSRAEAARPTGRTLPVAGRRARALVM